MVRIEHSATLLRVAPSCIDLLAKPLSYQHREYVPREGMRFEHKRLYRDTPQGLVTFVGLLPRILKILQRAGKQFEVVRIHPKTVPEADFSRVFPDPTMAPRAAQIEALSQFAARDRALVQAPTGTGKSTLLRDVARMWPRERILIVSPSVNISKQTYTDFRKEFAPDEVGLVCGRKDESDRRVVCCVDKSLGKVELSKFKILIYDEAHRAGSPTTSKILLNCGVERIFGVSASVKGRSDGTDLITEAIFGPIVADFSYAEVQEEGSVVPVEVRVISTQGMRSIAADDPHTRMRWGIRRNTVRNQLVAAAVEDVRKTCGRDAQILVTVDTVEHMAHLHKLLPDFELVYGNFTAEHRKWVRQGMLPACHPRPKPQVDEIIKRFRNGAVRCVIGTGTIGTGVDIPGLAAVVRADAAGSRIENTQRPGRVTRNSAGKDIGYVYDFDDRFDENLARRWDERRRVYQEKKWAIVPIRLSPIRGGSP